jgi:hypothetical protein
MACSAISGCSSGSGVVNNPKAPSTPLALTNVFVVQGTATSGKSVMQFKATAPGNASPVNTFAPSAATNILSVATDTAGFIYVGATTATGSAIFVFPVTANATTTSVRTILGGPQSFAYPYLMTLDATGSLYVSDKTNCNCVFVFSNSASGQAIPDRTIQGDLTQITNPVAIAVDSSGSVYVANHFGKYANVPAPQGAQVEIFAPEATGDVAPTQVITGTAAAPLSPILGMAVDEASNVYVDLGPAILEYTASSKGLYTQGKSIVVPATEAQSSTLRFDVNGNLFVLWQTVTLTPGIAVYPKTATGFQLPESPYSTVAWTGTSGNSQFALK